MKFSALSLLFVPLLLAWPSTCRAGDGDAASGATDRGAQHWSYRPLVPPVRPVATSRSSTTPIDAFIAQRLDQAGLVQARTADPTALIRRVSIDLIGLPPDPSQIDEFVNDKSPLAYRSLVDRLLASPRFGERWGRHWLDVARYADSITLRGQIFFEAWRYRDYVIGSLNQDLPLDQFIRQQIAGDLMAGDDIDQRRNNRIATAFLVLGNHNMEDQDKAKLRMDVVDEQLDVIGRGLLAQTITCARCHDHKFDPIPAADYYALAGILRNTKSLEHANVSKWLEVPLPSEAGKGDAPDDSSPKSMSVQEEPTIGDTQVHFRGSPHHLGDSAPRGFLSAISVQNSPTFSDRESGRRELADWLTSRYNPLTARVFANRTWHWLYGTGLVATTDNFGTTGEQPSHPELLDYLSIRLRDSAWSVKRLIREIVLSKAYRLSSDPHESLTPSAIARGQQVDPANRLLWRGNRRRLDAETLLDSMLAASGELQLTMGGSAIRSGTKVDFGYDHRGNHRRAVYWPVFRNSLPRMLEVFDFANPSVTVGSRNSSTGASQALFMMNNEFVIGRSQRVSARLFNEAPAAEEPKLHHLYRLILNRPPTPAEARTVMSFLHDARADKDQALWSEVAHSLFASIDFRYLK